MPHPVPPLAPGDPGVLGSPALFRLIEQGEHPGGTPEPDPPSIAVRLRRGAADVPSFERSVADLGGIFVSQDDIGREARRSIDMLAQALRLLAVVGTAVALLVLGQLATRLAFLDVDDQATFAAVGMTRRRLVTVGMLRFLRSGLAGGLLAAVLAVAASPLTPIGLARTAEPVAGLDIDVPVLATGALVVAAAVVLCALPALARRARPDRADGTGLGRPSAVARAAAGSGLAPPAIAGLHLAFDRGRGRAGLPVVSTMLATATGVAALLTAVVFGTSLGRLLDTPRLYGFTWDATVTSYGRLQPGSGGAARRRGAPRQLLARCRR